MAFFQSLSICSDGAAAANENFKNLPSEKNFGADAVDYLCGANVDDAFSTQPTQNNLFLLPQGIFTNDVLSLLKHLMKNKFLA